MSLDKIASVFLRLRQLDVVRITGGEPFLRSDLTEVVDAINKYARPPIIHITTNGTLTERTLAFIRNVKNTRNIHIKISIDAMKDEHNRIRGDNESYGKAMSTLVELSGLKRKYGFHLGVNQTIVSDKCFDDYNSLREICNKYGAALYPILAYTNPPLYEADNCSAGNQGGYKTGIFGNFSQRQIKEMFNIFEKNLPKPDDFAEKMVIRYYFKKLRRYLLEGISYQKTKCVALRSHLRLLPNGDVPVCLYNPAVVGNLTRETYFRTFWFKNEDIRRHRKNIRKCPGCWAKCELVPNGIYTGDIIGAVLSRKNKG